MTRPVDTPQAGEPLMGLSDHLAALARLASGEDMPPSGVFGQQGTASAPPPQVSVGLFKLTSGFQSGTPSPNWTSAPGSAFSWATASRVEYYPESNTWNTPADESDSGTTPEDLTVWAPAAMLQSTAAKEGEYVWCFYDEGPGAWVILSQAPPRWNHAAQGSLSLSDSDSLAEVSSGTITVPLAGTYLVAYDAIFYGNTGGPLWVRTLANLYINHAEGYSGDMKYGHAHPATSTAGANAWTVTIPIGAIDGTNPRAAVTLNLPPAGAGAALGPGQTVAVTTVPLNKNDVLSVGAGMIGGAGEVDVTILAVLLGP